MRLFNGAVITHAPSPRNVERIDNGALPMVIRMMQQGCRVDMDALYDLASFLSADCARIEDEIESCVGRRIKPGSPDQVRELLFDDLKVHKTHLAMLLESDIEKAAANGIEINLKNTRTIRIKLTAGGKASTGKLEIERFIHAHPVVRMILDWRQRDKLRGTYAVALIHHAIKQPDGTYRVFYQIKPTATDTGRFAGEDPNPMNVPIRTELGRRIKACFIPSPGCLMFEVDFSQIEMRVAADESGCAVMCDAFRNGKDIHTQTAMRVYGLPEDKVHPTRHRYPMKRTGFGVLYLISGMGLAYQLNSSDAQDPENPREWTDQECDSLIDEWYTVNHEIRDTQEEYFSRMRRYGMSWTMFGRIRLTPGVKSCHGYIRAREERQGANQPIQGGAADMFRLALGMLNQEYEQIRESGRRCEGLIPVHDAVVGEASEDIAHEIAGLTKLVMENVCELKIPIKADAKVGTRWESLRELK